jgi:hypothetical protein
MPQVFTALEAMVSEHQKRPSANGYADDHVLESLSTGAQ